MSNRQTPRLVLLIAIGLTCQPGCDARGRGEAVRPPAIPSQPVAETFANVRGGTYSLPGVGECKALAVIFLGHDCPVSNSYAPEIERLYRAFSPKEIGFCLVYADAEVKADEAQKHAREYGLTCPAILDPQMALARRVGVTIKPEAAVLSPKGALLYRGRIDDLYADYGKRRVQPTRRELQDALEAVLAGKPIAVTRTQAIGCDIDFPQ